jgi:hypothetical protein
MANLGRRQQEQKTPPGDYEPQYCGSAWRVMIFILGVLLLAYCRVPII